MRNNAAHSRPYHFQHFSFLLGRWIHFNIFKKRILLGQVEKKMFLVRISIKKEAGGRFFCYLLFPIECFLYTIIITFPQGYVGTLTPNINKTKHQILIQHKFV